MNVAVSIVRGGNRLQREAERHFTRLPLLGKIDLQFLPLRPGKFLLPLLLISHLKGQLAFPGIEIEVSLHAQRKVQNIFSRCGCGE